MDGKCIIIAAGDLTVGTIQRKEEDLCIAVDGGLSYCPVLEIEPDLIIGDFDSVTDQEREAVALLSEQIPERVITLPVEKDDTDTMAAIKIGLEKGYRDFRIYAGLGGRFDHSIANVQALLYLKNHDAVGYLLDGGSMVLVISNESVEFRPEMEGYVSLFALGDVAKGVTIRGLKYPLEGKNITNDFPLGISNEFIGEKSYIAVEEGSLLCIISYVQ